MAPPSVKEPFPSSPAFDVGGWCAAPLMAATAKVVPHLPPYSLSPSGKTEEPAGVISRYHRAAPSRGTSPGVVHAPGYNLPRTFVGLLQPTLGLTLPRRPSSTSGCPLPCDKMRGVYVGLRHGPAHLLEVRDAPNATGRRCGRDGGLRSEALLASPTAKPARTSYLLASQTREDRF
jgi:hypothetical protein